MAAVTSEFELSPAEASLLAEAGRTLDAIDTLQAVVDRDGEMVTTSAGDPKIHPALVELRQERMVFARLIAALRIPDAAGVGRTQRRGGPRGVYALRPVPS